MEQSGKVGEAKTKLSTKDLTPFLLFQRFDPFCFFRLEDSRLMQVYQELQDVLVKKNKKASSPSKEISSE